VSLDEACNRPRTLEIHVKKTNLSILPAALVSCGMGLAFVLAATGRPAGDGQVPEPTGGNAQADPQLLASAPVALTDRRIDVAPVEIREALSSQRAADLADRAVAPWETIRLALPVDPLLAEDARPQDYRRWYEGRSRSELIQSHLRFRGLLLFLKLHPCDDLEHVPVSYEARRMLASRPALDAEREWLASLLAELEEAPFSGALPARARDGRQDYERELGALDMEQLVVAKRALDHAFRSEKKRHVEAAFRGGQYTSRLLQKKWRG
jgi:hypothetical protein